MSRILQVTIIYCLIICSSLVQAEDSAWSYSTDSQEAEASDIFLPAASLFIPGLGQWCRGQFGSGALYTGVAIGGVKYAQNATSDFDITTITRGEFLDESVAVRKFRLGSQIYQASGGLSLYHTFRSAVWQRQNLASIVF